MKRFVVALVLFSLFGSVALGQGVKEKPASPQTATGPVNIGSRRELFVDDFLIDKLTGARLKLHEPQFAGIVFRFDQPWEGLVCVYNSVIRDDFGVSAKPQAGQELSPKPVARPPVYRMYYRTDFGICVVESADGIKWNRPEFEDELYKDKESQKTFKTNRILSKYIKNRSGTFAPFIDTRPGVPAAERYKAFAHMGLMVPPHLMTSEDGLHWKLLSDKRTDIKGEFDSHNVGFYSESEKCYVFYFRQGSRWVGRSTSQDFLNWTEAVSMEAVGVEKGFSDWARNQWKTRDLYTSSTTPYFRAPHIYISLASRFMAGKDATTEEQRKAAGMIFADYLKAHGFNDTVLLTSRGGARYDRTFFESFIRPGLGVKAWTTRANYAACGIVPTPDSDTQLSLYVAKETGYKSHHLARYTLRYDGFISVNAPFAWERDHYGRAKGAELLTKPLIFSGKRLFINYSTGAAGSVRVEMQDENGKSVEGRTLKDCPDIIGDEIEHEVKWKGGSDLSNLAGKAIRLRLVMFDADLYSIRFE